MVSNEMLHQSLRLLSPPLRVIAARRLASLAVFGTHAVEPSAQAARKPSRKMQVSSGRGPSGS